MTGGPTCTSDTTIPTFYARTPSITINHRLMTNSERYFTAMFNAMFGIWNWDLNLLTISPVHPHEGRVIPGRGGTLDVGKRNLPFVSGSQWDVKPFKGNNMHCIVQVSLRWKKKNSCQFHFSRILKHWKWSNQCAVQGYVRLLALCVFTSLPPKLVDYSMFCSIWLVLSINIFQEDVLYAVWYLWPLICSYSA